MGAYSAAPILTPDCLNRIIKEIADFDKKKLKIKKKRSREIEVISGPYKSVNLLKNDYIKLKNIGFEEMDIFINE